MSNELKYVVKYKDRYFTIIIVFIYFIIFITASPLFYIDYSNNIQDIISFYFLCGDRYAFSLRALAILNIICFFIYKEHYMFFSLGEIFIYDEYLICKPRIILFQIKKIYYDKACIELLGRSYIEDVFSLRVSNTIGEKKSFIAMIQSINVFFLFGPMCLNEKKEIFEIYNFLYRKIDTKCKKNGSDYESNNQR